MAPYQQHPATHNWGRWPQHQPSSDYVMMDEMVGYDTRTLPSSAPLQRPVMAPQYVMGNSYGDSPVTPMSASNYPSHSHFGDYGSYNQPSPSLTSPFQQHPDRFPHRPMAPPTPPLDSDSHSIYSRDGQAPYTPRDASRRSSTKPVTVVKTEDANAQRTPKTIDAFIKEDGSLQFESNEKFDALLRLIPKALCLDGVKNEEQSPCAAPTPAAKEEPDTKAPLKKYKCEFPGCSRSFAQKAPYKTHMDTHKGIKSHQCDVCGIFVSQAGNLQTHKRCHTEEKPFACGLCGKLFKQRGNVKPHIENVHERKNKVICNFPRCGRNFTTIGNMKNHIGKVHKAVVNELLFKVESLKEGEKLEDHWVNLFKEYTIIFKNSNKGIKGRGQTNNKISKHEQNTMRNKINGRRDTTQQMTPVSPEPMHVSAVNHNRSQYYDQHQQGQTPFHGLPLPAQPQTQPPFHGLPLPAQPQQQQPTPHYTPISMHQPQTPSYHTLPQPMGNNMGWAPQYQ
ncbi:DNA-binding transcription factor [Diaporthe australafricana]|uniref:C2H2 type master regulator of conidiophore development brlA n=1 Tax=Diaporthe australafricana TaxID=127596 RepID=A0ABR3WHT5_9PEZI